MTRSLIAAAIIAAAAALPTAQAAAHCVIGQRFFPATIATEDPCVADELSAPAFSYLRVNGEEGATRQNEFAFDFARRITPDLGFSIGEAYRIFRTTGQRTQTGFGNLELGLTYQFFRALAWESTASFSLGFEVGGTGAQRVDADRFTTITPEFRWGQGFGRLPDSVGFLRPLALTGNFGLAIPTSSQRVTTGVDPDSGETVTDIERHPHVLQIAGAIQYSIAYLQSFVRDVGLGAPFNRLYPVVEYSFEIPLDRGQSGQWTGTVNPGVIWSGQRFQVGVEAIVPLNARTGRSVGVMAQLHFYLDDLVPSVFGRPIFASVR